MISAAWGDNNDDNQDCTHASRACTSLESPAWCHRGKRYTPLLGDSSNQLGLSPVFLTDGSRAIAGGRYILSIIRHLQVAGPGAGVTAAAKQRRPDGGTAAASGQTYN